MTTLIAGTLATYSAEIGLFLLIGVFVAFALARRWSLP